MYRETYVEINENNLMDNIKNIKRNYPDYKYYFGVVKADAYGHGDIIVKDMIKAGINYIAVATMEEAVRIREYNKNIPILCFGYIAPEFLEFAYINNITITIVSDEYFETIKDTKFKIKAHIKLNTGLNRLGIKDRNKLEKVIKEIEETNIELEGIYTHFGTSGVYDTYFDKQLNAFEELTRGIDLSKIPIVHLYNSLSLVKHKKHPQANGVRLGIIMYGFSMNTNLSPEKMKFWNIFRLIKLHGKKASEVTINNSLKLEKVMSIYSEVIHTTYVKKGEFVGYNAKYIAPSDCYLATVAIGHADGITDAYKEVMINDIIFEVVAVFMDYIVVKVDKFVKVHDQVTIIGDKLTFNKVATSSGEDIHHLLVQISSRLPRIYVKAGR